MPVLLDLAGLLRDAFDKQKLTGSTEELLLIADYAVDRAQTTMADILAVSWEPNRLYCGPDNRLVPTVSSKYIAYMMAAADGSGADCRYIR